MLILGGVTWVLVAAKYSNVSFVSVTCRVSLDSLRNLAELFMKGCLSYSELLGEFVLALIWLFFPILLICGALTVVVERLSRNVRQQS
jgi:hypothetical protein